MIFEENKLDTCHAVRNFPKFHLEMLLFNLAQALIKFVTLKSAKTFFTNVFGACARGNVFLIFLIAKNEEKLQKFRVFLCQIIWPFWGSTNFVQIFNFEFSF